MKKLLLAFALILSGMANSQVILSEDFESGLPGTWTQVTNASDGGWLAGNASALSSSSWTIPTSNSTNMVATNDDGCNCDKNLDRLISPSMDLSAVSNVVFTVDVYFGGLTYQGNTETANIQISTDGGSTWSNLATVAGGNAWSQLSYDLTSYVGNNNVKIAFDYSDGTGWLYGWAVDNFEVKVPNANDVELTGVSLQRYGAISTPYTIAMDITNAGTNPVTSITVDWNDGTAHSQTIPVNIPAFGSAQVNHPTAVNYATAYEAFINIDITSVNGGADDDPSNNVGSTLFNSVSTVVPKNVVIEEGTGTWCGWCPRGAVAMEYMTNTYPAQFIGIAVHNGDPMTVAAYDNAANFSGFPGCNVDRLWLDQSVSQSAFEGYYNARKDLIVPAGLVVDAVKTPTNIMVDVTATFYTPFASANYRLAVVMVEDGVTGTTSGYNQANYYSGGGTPMGGYESLPDPVPASQMVYDHVGRALLGGYNGQTGSVPGTVSDGTTASYTFNYTVPAGQNWQNMHAVALVIDQSTGEIVNAEKADVVLNVEELSNINMNVYPNPASETFNIVFEAQNKDYFVKVMDLQGRVVMSGDYENLSGKQLITVPAADLAGGSYMVTISTDEGSKTMNVVVE